MARQIARPVKRLVDATRKVSEGQYTGPIEVTSRDEIGELAGHSTRWSNSSTRSSGWSHTSGRRPEGRQLAGQSLRVGACWRSERASRGATTCRRSSGSGGMGVVYRAYDREVGERSPSRRSTPSSPRGIPGPRALQAGVQARPPHHPPQPHDLLSRRSQRHRLHHHGVGARHHARSPRSEAGDLATPAALTIGKQVCRALEVAHEEGIVHRDIKPGNLMVAASGFLKVMDFGIARLTERAQVEPRPLRWKGWWSARPGTWPPSSCLASRWMDGPISTRLESCCSSVLPAGRFSRPGAWRRCLVTI